MPDRKLTVIPPDELNGVWHMVRDGLSVVAQYGDGWIPEDVYAACKNGHATLHLCEDVHGNYDGFVVLSLRSGFTGSELIVWTAHSPNYGQPLSVWCGLIKEVAKQAKAKKLVFYSPRRAWGKVALEMGFREAQVMYSMEVV